MVHKLVSCTNRCDGGDVEPAQNEQTHMLGTDPSCPIRLQLHNDDTANKISASPNNIHTPNIPLNPENQASQNLEIRKLRRSEQDLSKFG